MRVGQVPFVIARLAGDVNQGYAADWDTFQVAEIIKRYGVKLPVGYRLWGRNLVNLEYAVLQQVRMHFPADYAIIKTWFPLVEAEFFRYEVVGQ